jgi:hypothetical protein
VVRVRRANCVRRGVIGRMALQRARGDMVSICGRREMELGIGFVSSEV